MYAQQPHNKEVPSKDCCMVLTKGTNRNAHPMSKATVPTCHVKLLRGCNPVHAL